MATTKKTTSNKTSATKVKTTKKPRATKPKAIRSAEAEKEIAALKEETEKLRAENLRMAEQFGKMLEENANFRLKANAMLGQVLKGLYLIGIAPDDIQAKCQQMFRKKVIAD